MATIIRKWQCFAFILAIFCPIGVFATTPCQSGQQTWLYTVDTSNQSHIVACLSEASGVVPWFGYINTLVSATTVTIDAKLGNEQKITIGTNVTGSTLQNPIAGQWIFITVVEDNVGGHTFQQPANFVNWQAITTTANATTTEVGWFDGTYFQVVSAGGGGGGGSCPAGAGFTQYVDSSQGNDSNGGTNWCDAKLTEAAAVTALGAGGGWVYVAPNYGGAAATGVPANVHILETNQFTADDSDVNRLSFPDPTETSNDLHSVFFGSNSTAADASAVWDWLNPFGSSVLQSNMTGMVTIPAAGGGTNDYVGLTGIVSSLNIGTQASGVMGMCLADTTDANGQDCTGVVGVAGAKSGTQASTALEALWGQVSTAVQPGIANGLVLRAVGGNMPTSDNIGGLYSAAITVRTPGITTGNQWPWALHVDDYTTTEPISLGLPSPNLADYGNDGIFLRYNYNSGTGEAAQFRVTGSNSVVYPFGGDFQFLNYHANGAAATSTVNVQTNVDGYAKVEAVKAVGYTGTPVFDRTLGSVQTITLTGNVTGSTLQNCFAGQTIIFDIIEDGSGGHSFVAPTNLHGFTAITTTISFHNRQMFYCDGSSSNSGGYSVSTMQSGT
jgi:hypothetical protein